MSVQDYVDEWNRWAPRAGPSWLARVRRAAIERFQAVGFPTPRIEDWHFTRVAPIAERVFSRIESDAGKLDAFELAPYTFGATDWTQLVFLNGHFVESLSTHGALPAGAHVTNLATALTDREGQLRDLAERYLATIAPPADQAFTALNSAFLTDGALVHIPADAEISQPIHLVYVSDAAADGGVTYPRSLIILDRFARATIVESYIGMGGVDRDPTYFTNAVAEVALAEGAQLAHIRIQREGSNAFHVGTAQARQDRDSRYASFSFATGAALSRQNIYTALNGPGAEATLHGLYMTDGEQHLDHQTRIEHRAPNCASREVYKGILGGASHGVFNGKVYVHPEAQKTDGKQTNNNLLISPDARVDTKPQLEIFADDVKCTHGATVGRLDEVALFYLKSRGIRAAEARTLLTYAFAAEVLEGIESETVRQGLEALTRGRFVDVPAIVGR